MAIGLEKMLKIMLANYLLIPLCLGASPTIDLFLSWFGSAVPSAAASMDSLFTNKTIATLVIYLLLLVVLFLKSRIDLDIPANGLKKIGMTVLSIPMTVVSIIVTLQIAILGIQAFDITALQHIVSTRPVTSIYKDAIVYTPVIMMVHVLIMVIMMLDIKWLPVRRM
ncbi:MAG: hypothetical protein WCJ81_03500 [bacterium]